MRLLKDAVVTYKYQRDFAILALNDVLRLYNRLTKHVLKKHGDEIEGVLGETTMCVNQSLSRLKAELEEDSFSSLHLDTDKYEEYMDCCSAEEEMDHPCA